MVGVTCSAQGVVRSREQGHGEVTDVSLPLRRQLEKLYSWPLRAVYTYCNKNSWLQNTVDTQLTGLQWEEKAFVLGQKLCLLNTPTALVFFKKLLVMRHKFPGSRSKFSQTAARDLVPHKIFKTSYKKTKQLEHSHFYHVLIMISSVMPTQFSARINIFH